jgi:aspartate/methionine/tyrosine aminotransferase
VSDKFVLSEYPYDRLNHLKRRIVEKFGEVVDLSIGTPIDPSPKGVRLAYSDLSNTEVGYPPSVGSGELLLSTINWLEFVTGVKIGSDEIGSCVGTKEFIALLPGFLKLLYPDKDTVFGPSLSYPTYQMGADLANLKYETFDQGHVLEDLLALDHKILKKILCIYINSPANPTGNIYDLTAIKDFAQENNILLVSDECYMEYNWVSEPKTILGKDNRNVLAVHSLSKRSNAAGIRVGSYCGDKSVVGFLKEIRKHAGLMIPGPSQRAAVAAYSDYEHIKLQRNIYKKRLEILIKFFENLGLQADMPEGGFYLWIRLHDDPRLENITFSDTEPLDKNYETELYLDQSWTNWIGLNTGVLVSPGSFYGPTGVNFIRIAAVAKTDRLERLLEI